MERGVEEGQWGKEFVDEVWKETSGGKSGKESTASSVGEARAAASVSDGDTGVSVFRPTGRLGARQKNSREERVDGMFIGEVGDEPDGGLSSDDGDSNASDSDELEESSNTKFQRLMRVQSFGEMPMRQMKIVESSFKGDMGYDGGEIKSLKGNTSYVPSWQSPGGTSYPEESEAGKKERSRQQPTEAEPDPRYDELKVSTNSNFATPQKSAMAAPHGLIPSPIQLTDDGGTESDGSRLSPSLRDDPNEVLKRRQASRRAARRALSANNADDRLNPRENGVDNPGTPVAIGKYYKDGTRESLDISQKVGVTALPLNALHKQAKVFDEDQPLKTGGGYNVDMMMDNITEVDRSESFDAATLVAPNMNTGGKVVSGSKMSLATRRRMERVKKEQQQQNLRLSQEGLAASAPVEVSRSEPKKKKKPSTVPNQVSKRSANMVTHDPGTGSIASFTPPPPLSNTSAA